MKKVLLGTTALVAASALAVDAAKAEVGVSMWAYQSFGIALDTDNQAVDTGLVSYQNANVDFKASGELDNGMSVGMTIDMAATGGSNGTIDEMRFSLSDDWGVIILGSDDSAADLMNGSYWVTGNGLNGGVWSAYGSTFSAATDGSVSSDATGIRYFTPTMSGFRVGVSYQPGSDDANNSTVTGSGSQVFENVFSAGAEYKGDMDGVGIGLAAGVDHIANFKRGDQTAAAAAGGDDSFNDVFVRGSVSTGGFMVGLAYNTIDYDTSNTAKVDEYTLAATVSYSTGPHTVGFEYLYSEADTTKTTANDDVEENGYLIGYNNSLGGGVYWDARLAILDYDASGTANDDEIMAFETGVGISF